MQILCKIKLRRFDPNFFYFKCGIQSRCINLASTDIKNISVTLNGGIMAALADSACGVALITVLGQNEWPVTMSLNINYIHPAGISNLTAKSRLFSRRSRASVLEADIFDPDGTLIAHANSILAIKRGEKK